MIFEIFNEKQCIASKVQFKSSLSSFPDKRIIFTCRYCCMNLGNPKNMD